MYIPQDPPLVVHMPTSWQPARSRSLPHMHVQRWDLGSDLNEQLPGQKTNTLPLCQRLGYYSVNVIARSIKSVTFELPGKVNMASSGVWIRGRDLGQDLVMVST